MSKDKGYSVTIHIGKKPTPVKLRLAAIQMRGIADRLVALADGGKDKPL